MATTASEAQRLEQFEMLMNELRRHRAEEVESKEAELLTEKLSGLLRGAQR